MILFICFNTKFTQKKTLKYFGKFETVPQLFIDLDSLLHIVKEIEIYDKMEKMLIMITVYLSK
jgi:glutaredoxin-related protein